MDPEEKKRMLEELEQCDATVSKQVEEERKKRKIDDLQEQRKKYAIILKTIHEERDRLYAEDCPAVPVPIKFRLSQDILDVFLASGKWKLEHIERSDEDDSCHWTIQRRIQKIQN